MRAPGPHRSHARVETYVSRMRGLGARPTTTKYIQKAGMTQSRTTRPTPADLPATYQFGDAAPVGVMVFHQGSWVYFPEVLDIRGDGDHLVLHYRDEHGHHHVTGHHFTYPVFVRYER